MDEAVISAKKPNQKELAAAHYRELTSRNVHFVSADLQEKLRQFKILIGGCGSTGGACIESLARAGVCHFALADNGEYELNNLNRQHARLENLGENKAQFHAQEIKNINPYAEIVVHTNGINIQNVEELVSWADFVFDAVDVTTAEGIKAKVLLHQKCHALRKPVLSGLDLGYLQWGCSFDYRHGRILPLNGRDKWALDAEHPISALFRMYPARILPSHSLELFSDLLTGKAEFASQMGCTSDALSAVIVPAVLKYLEYGELIPGWRVDMSKYRYTMADRLIQWWKGRPARRQLKKMIRSGNGPS